jgi:hypothetical protein
METFMDVLAKMIKEYYFELCPQFFEMAYAPRVKDRTLEAYELYSKFSNDQGVVPASKERFGLVFKDKDFAWLFDFTLARWANVKNLCKTRDGLVGLSVRSAEYKVSGPGGAKGNTVVLQNGARIHGGLVVALHKIGVDILIKSGGVI